MTAPDDLVARLRAAGKPIKHPVGITTTMATVGYLPLYDEAANRIESLQADLARKEEALRAADAMRNAYLCLYADAYGPEGRPAGVGAYDTARSKTPGDRTGWDRARAIASTSEKS